MAASPGIDISRSLARGDPLLTFASHSVRYLRLSHIRVHFGARGHTQPHATFPHAVKVAYDENYLACDIVINWVADNLVLCFIHAIVGEKTAHTSTFTSHSGDPSSDVSQDDNDEGKKTSWTNWCGTHVMNNQVIVSPLSLFR